MRAGPRPVTTTQIPHAQVDQQPADGRLLDLVLAQAAKWPGVQIEPSGISVPGAQALVMVDAAQRSDDAFIVGREFAHGHSGGDYSLHMALPAEAAEAAISAGWAEPHFLAGKAGVPPTIVMVYAPRDLAEVDVVLTLLKISFDYASPSSLGVTDAH